MQIKKLEEYCRVMLLDFHIEKGILFLNNSTYAIEEDGSRKLFDEDMNYIDTKGAEVGTDGFVFEFGGRWYTQDLDEAEAQLVELKYIGKAAEKISTKAFLGVRSGFELMNGMGMYPEWIKKAKFLGVETLAICEKKTLGGVLSFQSECEYNGIKSIIGLTIPINKDESYEVKLYAKNFQGWLNLLKFNEKLNVLNEHYISEEFLLKNSNDLFIVLDPKTMRFQTLSKELSFRADFYQLDTAKFLNEEKDSEYLDNLELWIKSSQTPISITDAFYLEKEDWKTREVMWATAKAFDEKTDNQHFKSKTEYASELINLFEKGNKSWIKLYKKAIESEKELVDGCDFKYDTQTRHLPKYEMSEEELKEHSTNEELFLHLMKEGFKNRKITEPKKYIERLKLEVEVLKSGDVIDYFLSLHDIIKYSKAQNMLTGIGRGSAGGSLVAYLLGIIQVNPLDFNLSFERFLNSGRMGEWVDKPFFTYIDEEGKEIGLAEGELIRIKRKGEEITIFSHEVKEGDEIIKI